MKKLPKEYINEISQEVKDSLNVEYINQLMMDDEFSQANDKISSAVKDVIGGYNFKQNEINQIAQWASETELENCKNTLKASSNETPSNAYISIKCRQSVCKEFVELSKQKEEEHSL